jgi:hypothetical protein
MTGIGESQKKAQKISAVLRYFMMVWVQRVGDIFVWRQDPLSTEIEKAVFPARSDCTRSGRDAVYSTNYAMLEPRPRLKY